MSSKPTWVFVVGPYRTASTTQYEIVRDILEATKSGKGVGYYDQRGWKVRNFDDAEHGKMIVCKAFVFLPYSSPQVNIFFEQGRLRAAATIRDPRDIATSMKIRSERLGNDDWSFETTVVEYFPKWLAQFETWVEKLGPDDIIVSKYEEFTTDLLTEVHRLSEFLGVDLSDDQAKNIAVRYDKEAMMIRKKKAHKKGEKEDEWLPSIPSIVTGVSGKYKEHLTLKELNLVEETNADFMRRWGYA
ncbi:hypothetical protein GF373_17685 [bacterium]|nr:hypothetical protein [bacterium]